MKPQHRRIHVALLAGAALILAACADDLGITPPDPQFAVGQTSQQLVVTTTEDTVDCDPAPGECSLRGAIVAANNDPEGGPYTIVLVADETYQLTLGGSLAVGSAIVIKANGATIRQTAEGRVLTVRTDADLTLDGAAVTGGNQALGGGIWNNRGTLTLTNSTVSGNVADFGGAIYQMGGRTTVVNTTISGNRASSFPIDGVGIVVVDGGGDLALVNSTVTANRSDIVFLPRPTVRNFDGTLTLSNTIVAEQAVGSDCGANITSLGHNLDSDGSCGLTSAGDRPSANANLGELEDNGGPTRTHALLEGSDAIGAGDTNVCAAEPVDGVDQRGVRRPQGTACDIGAFELEVAPAPTALTAEPALLQVEGGLLGLRIRLLDLSAQLVLADTRAPIAGETVVMTVDRVLGGNQQVCTAVTDADGVATCSGGLGSLLGLVLSGYTATFTGTDEYEPSSASARLIRIGG